MITRRFWLWLVFDLCAICHLCFHGWFVICSLSSLTQCSTRSFFLLRTGQSLRIFSSHLKCPPNGSIISQVWLPPLFLFSPRCKSLTISSCNGYNSWSLKLFSEFRYLSCATAHKKRKAYSGDGWWKNHATQAIHKFRISICNLYCFRAFCDRSWKTVSIARLWYLREFRSAEVPTEDDSGVLAGVTKFIGNLVTRRHSHHIQGLFCCWLPLLLTHSLGISKRKFWRSILSAKKRSSIVAIR